MNYHFTQGLFAPLGGISWNPERPPQDVAHCPTLDYSQRDYALCGPGGAA